MVSFKCNRCATFSLFFFFFFISEVYKSFIDLYILEFTEIKCTEVLKSLSDDQKQKFCDGNLEDINFPTNQNIFFNIFGELLKIAKALASNRNIVIKNMLIKINSYVSDAVNVSSPVKKNTKMKNIKIFRSLHPGNDLIIVSERKKSFPFIEKKLLEGLLRANTPFVFTIEVFYNI